MTEQAHKQPFWEELGLPAPGTRMTVKEYQELPEVNFHMELIDGVVIYPHWDEESMTPAPIPDHQAIVMNVIKLLLPYEMEHGGQVFTAPIDVYLDGSDPVQPDILWLAPDSNCAKTEKNLQGAPELIVEVLSPSTARRDKIEKFNLYEQHGVQEYWIVDPHNRLVEVYVRSGAVFSRQGVYAPDDVFKAPVLDGYVITVRTIFGG